MEWAATRSCLFRPFCRGSYPVVTLTTVSHVTLEYEIACVNAQVLAAGAVATTLCAVGLWTDMSVRILQLPTLTQLSKEPLAGGASTRAAAKPSNGRCLTLLCFVRIIADTIPRSILIAPFAHELTLLAGLGTSVLPRHPAACPGRQPAPFFAFASVLQATASCSRSR